MSNKHIKRQLRLVSFTIYLAVMAAVTIVPTHFSRVRNPSIEHVNLTPFAYSFKCILGAHRVHHDLMGFCLRNTFGNIILFLPLGILLPWTFDRWRSLGRVIALASCISISIETIQFFSRFIGSPRAVDIDDVLLNTLGAAIGYVVYWCLRKLQGQISKRKRKGLNAGVEG